MLYTYLSGLLEAKADISFSFTNSRNTTQTTREKQVNKGSSSVEFTHELNHVFPSSSNELKLVEEMNEKRSPLSTVLCTINGHRSSITFGDPPLISTYYRWTSPPFRWTCTDFRYYIKKTKKWFLTKRKLLLHACILITNKQGHQKITRLVNNICQVMSGAVHLPVAELCSLSGDMPAVPHRAIHTSQNCRKEATRKTKKNPLDALACVTLLFLFLTMSPSREKKKKKKNSKRAPRRPESKLSVYNCA